MDHTHSLSTSMGKTQLASHFIILFSHLSSGQKKKRVREREQEQQGRGLERMGGGMKFFESDKLHMVIHSIYWPTHVQNFFFKYQTFS